MGAFFIWGFGTGGGWFVWEPAVPAMGGAVTWLSPLKRLLQGSGRSRGAGGRGSWMAPNKNAAGGLLSTSGLIRCFRGS